MHEESYYTAYIQRERQAMVEALVHESREVLAVPQVARRLGNYAVELLQLLDQVEVPQIVRHKLISQHQATHTQMVAVHPHEYIFRDPWRLEMHHNQQQSLQAGFGTETAEQLSGCYSDNRDWRAHPQRVESLHELEGFAYTSRIATEVPTTIGQVGVESAPVVLLNAARKEQRHPIVVLHELVHVHQVHEYPIILPDDDFYRDQVEREVEAYYVEGELINGLTEAGHGDQLIAALGARDIQRVQEICDVRRQVHGDSDEQIFDANDELLDALAQRNLFVL